MDIRSSKIKDNSIETICKSLPNIEDLYVSESGISDPELLKVGCLLPRLKLLYADKNNISYETADHLITYSRNLVYLSVKQCNINKKEGKELIKKGWKAGKCVEAN